MFRIISPTRRLPLFGGFCAVLVCAQAQDNGIAVGRPKVFDNRSLTIMLDQLSQALQQAQFVDQKALAANLGMLQGFESEDVTRSLTITASGLPKGSGNANNSSTKGDTKSTSSGKIKSKSGDDETQDSSSGTKANSASGFSDGSDSDSNQSSGAKDTSKSSSKSDGSGSGTGSGGGSDIPVLPASMQFGANPGDLLSDQVNLTYQVFNLRMLLERSLSDRLLLPNGDTRLQAVLGFNVTLDPHNETRDSAAVVEITVHQKNSTIPVSLVAMMPQEKTYNSAALSTHSNSFGASAVARIVTVGYSQTRKGKLFYLFRDNDTFAFERMSPDATAPVVFGWEFRPVLGRRSVSPGTRQMLAVVSLPDRDEPGVNTSQQLTFSVRTYWKHYDRKTLTTYYGEPPAKRIEPRNWRFFSLPLPHENTRDYPDIEVPTSFFDQKNLSAKVSSVFWKPTDESTGIVEINGKNFFLGTTVKLGSTLYTGANDGLVFKSDQKMILHTTAANVSQRGGVINGRYGAAVPVRFCAPCPSPGIALAKFAIEPSGGQFSQITVDLQDLNTKSLDYSCLAGMNPPLVSFNGTPLPGAQLIGIKPEVSESTRMVSNPPSSGIITSAGSGLNAAITATVPNSLLGTKDGVVHIVFPFYGPKWSFDVPIYDKFDFTVTRVGESGEAKNKKTILLISNPGSNNFRQKDKCEKPNCKEPNWSVLLDDSYVLDQGGIHNATAKVELKSACETSATECYTLRLTADSQLLNGFKRLALVSPEGYVKVLDIPSATPAAVKPTLDPKAPLPSVVQNEVRAVSFNGTGLQSIKKVLFLGNELPFSAGEGGKTITVFVSRDVTAKPGRMELLLQGDLQTNLPAPLIVEAAPESAKTRGSEADETNSGNAKQAPQKTSTTSKKGTKK